MGLHGQVTLAHTHFRHSPASPIHVVDKTGKMGGYPLGFGYSAHFGASSGRNVNYQLEYFLYLT